jgi:phage terminase small subunit
LKEVALMVPKRQRFVDEYLIDLNATQAAIRAGYSAKRADAIGYDLLRITEVKAAIDAALEERRKKSEITAEYVLTNLREVVERCLQRAPVVDMKGRQVQDEEGRDVWEFNAPGVNKALELLGRHLGMFTDKVQMDVTLSPVTILSEVEKRRGGSE